MNDSDDIWLAKRIRVLQIIAGALVMGLVTFLGIVLFMVQVQNKGVGLARPGGLPLISLIAVAYSALAVLLAIVIPRVLVQSGLRRIAAGAWKPPQDANAADYPDDASKLLAIRQTSIIIGLAILEGSALFACIAYLLEGQSWVLAAAVLIVLLMLASFPTQERLRSWLTAQADQLDELRRQGDAAAER